MVAHLRPVLDPTRVASPGQNGRGASAGGKVFPADQGGPVVKVHVRDVPRRRDDEVLGVLAARLRGASWREAAEAVGGTSWGALRLACLSVRAADLSESEEPRAVVAAGYR